MCNTIRFRKIFSLLLCAHLLAITPVLMAGQPGRSLLPPPSSAMSPQQQQQQDGMPKLSAEDIKMLQDVEQEINKFVTSLPQEEQKKFWNEVDELTKVMGTMNEDELVKFMEGVLQEQEAQQSSEIQQPSPIPMPGPSFAPAPVEKPAEVIPAPTTPSEKEQHVFKLIEAILLMLNNFITKTQAIPELPGKVQSWITEGKLRGATPDTTWNSLRSSIEELMNKMTKMKDRDPISGSYKYLAELIKDESMVNNLLRLKDVLNRHEPKIDISPFGQERMNHQSRESMRGVLNALIEATTIMGMPSAFDKIIEKYEPTAKKIRETEEAAQRKAIESSRRSPYPAPAVVVGKSEEKAGGAARDYSKFDFGLAPYKPAPIPAPAKEKEAEKSKTDTKGGSKKPEAAGGDKKGEKPKDEKGKTEKALEAEDKEAAEALGQFSKNMFELAMTLEDHEDELTGRKEMSSDTPGELAKLPDHARNALYSIRTLRRRLTQLEKAKPHLKGIFKRSVNEVFKDNKEYLDLLKQASVGEDLKDTFDKTTGKLQEIKEVAEKL